MKHIQFKYSYSLFKLPTSHYYYYLTNMPRPRLAPIPSAAATPAGRKSAPPVAPTPPTKAKAAVVARTKSAVGLVVAADATKKPRVNHSKSYQQSKRLQRSDDSIFARERLRRNVRLMVKKVLEQNTQQYGQLINKAGYSGTVRIKNKAFGVIHSYIERRILDILDGSAKLIQHRKLKSLTDADVQLACYFMNIHTQVEGVVPAAATEVAVV